ncbi:hypothetical protein HAX54_034515, partial [Datura stramonium]|nr:hypothetical protein [Datura stramonium]
RFWEEELEDDNSIFGYYISKTLCNHIVSAIEVQTALKYELGSSAESCFSQYRPLWATVGCRGCRDDPWKILENDPSDHKSMSRVVMCRYDSWSRVIACLGWLWQLVVSGTTCSKE